LSDRTKREVTPSVVAAKLANVRALLAALMTYVQ